MDKKITRWPRLMLGAIVLFFSGIIYAWSVIKAPFGDGGFGWGSDKLGFNYTLTMCFFCIGGLVSGIIGKKISAKLRMIVSGLLVFGGFLLTSMLDGSNVFLLYVGYGFMAGLGIGIVYNVVIALTNAWFPDKKGTCSGILMMAFGFSSLVLGKLAAKLFVTESFGWSKTYLVYGIIIGAVIVVAGLFIRGPKEDEAECFASKVVAKSNTTAELRQEYSTVQMIKRRSFWMLFIFFVLSSAVGGIALSFGKDVFLSLGTSENLAITVASFLAVFNGVGRICSGAIFDAIGMRKTQFVSSGVVILASVVTLVGLLTGVSALGIAGVCLCAFSYGFSPTVSSASAMEFYGKKSFSLNFAVLNLVLIPSAFYATIAGKIVEATGSFNMVFIILTVCSVVALIDIAFVKKA